MNIFYETNNVVVNKIEIHKFFFTKKIYKTFVLPSFFLKSF